MGYCKKEELILIKNFLLEAEKDNFVDCHRDLTIERSHPINKNISGINFLYSQVKYPLLIHRFGKYEILAEIIIKEKQYAIGVQPMLYFCFPVLELKSEVEIIGRTAKTKEFADFVIDKENISVFLEMLKIFGLLSYNHNQDIIKIIDQILLD